MLLMDVCSGEASHVLGNGNAYLHGLDNVDDGQMVPFWIFSLIF